MTKGTFWLAENSYGGISIGIEDYDVEVFGGMDYEWIYALDSINTAKMVVALEKIQEGSLEQMIEAEFGIHLDEKNLGAWLDGNGIEYEFSSWMS